MNYNDARNLRMIMLGESDWLERFTINVATDEGSQEFACYILDDRTLHYQTLYVVRSVQEWRNDKKTIKANLTEKSAVVA